MFAVIPQKNANARRIPSSGHLSQKGDASLVTVQSTLPREIDASRARPTRPHKRAPRTNARSEHQTGTVHKHMCTVLYSIRLPHQGHCGGCNLVYHLQQKAAHFSRASCSVATRCRERMRTPVQLHLSLAGSCALRYVGDPGQAWLSQNNVYIYIYIYI